MQGDPGFSEDVPRGHRKHWVAPSVSEEDPLGQLVHVTEFGKENVPIKHFLHSDAPVKEIVPAGQGIH